MNKQPKTRSRLRIFAGTIFYTIKRFHYWHISHQNFANKIQPEPFPHKIFSHQSTLLKPLKNVEMWMQYNKIINLQIAIKQLNGLIIEPEEIFSYWRQIGKPTRRKGYLKGMVLHNGTVQSGIGGGLCQLSNLIYWLTLHTPLMVIERWRHGYDVFPDIKRTQPFGSGATCSYPNIDLQIKNNTSQKFQLQLELSSTHLIGKWLSDKPITVRYEILEKNHAINHEWWGQYIRSNELYRTVIDKTLGQKTGEEFITKNHAIMMYEPFLEKPAIRSKKNQQK